MGLTPSVAPCILPTALFPVVQFPHQTTATGYGLATDGSYATGSYVPYVRKELPYSGLELAAFIMLEVIFTTSYISRLEMTVTVIVQSGL